MIITNIRKYYNRNQIYILVNIHCNCSKRQTLSKYIYKLRDYKNMSKMKNVMNNQFTNKVQINVDMSSANIINKIGGHVESGFIITKYKQR